MRLIILEGIVLSITAILAIFVADMLDMQVMPSICGALAGVFVGVVCIDIWRARNVR